MKYLGDVNFKNNKVSRVALGKKVMFGEPWSPSYLGDMRHERKKKE